MNTIKETKELCRVTFNDGDFQRLMVQDYTNREPFFYITHGEKFTRVETSNDDLSAIITQLKRELSISQEGLNSPYMDKYPEIKKIHEYYIQKRIEFIDMIESLNLIPC
jgi:hypothetical protein